MSYKKNPRADRGKAFWQKVARNQQELEGMHETWFRSGPSTRPS